MRVRLFILSFDNTNGTIVVNDGSGGSAMNGVRIGAATIVGGGRYGNALSINGTSGSYVLIPNQVTSLDCTTTGAAWTYALWLKTDHRRGRSLAIRATAPTGIPRPRPVFT